ncbi:MAG: hypothetical protein DMD53_01760 [Gemmatimonadetes bacterium]|nr:MAG: hypothetical protein DMD53_01760 [Gemmatimonadota bacterium]
MTVKRRIAAALVPLVLAAAGQVSQGPELPPERTGKLRVDVAASGFKDPLYLTAPAGDPRLFVVEQAGRVKIVEHGRVLPTPFLDIVDSVDSGGERGLLSLAFHPRYATSGWFYVNYTDRHGDTRVKRFSVSADPNLADPASGRQILFVNQPFSNHNGGLVMFGPDGMLYIGMGDGGGGGDPMGNGQNPATLLGKLLRIDVDHGDPYAIPADNPFVGAARTRGEVWAMGMRNPWRFAFDRAAGLLYVADVGQNLWEEIDVVAAGRGGLNYGWNVMEGAHCYAEPGCKGDGLVLPALEYGHADGCAIIGGFTYRGRASPALVGQYFYSDYCRGWLRSLTYDNGRVTSRTLWDVRSLGSVMSFGVDGAGEIYVLSDNGKVYTPHSPRLSSGDPNLPLRTGISPATSSQEASDVVPHAFPRPRSRLRGAVRVSRSRRAALDLDRAARQPLRPDDTRRVPAGARLPSREGHGLHRDRHRGGDRERGAANRDARVHGDVARGRARAQAHVADGGHVDARHQGEPGSRRPRHGRGRAGARRGGRGCQGAHDRAGRLDGPGAGFHGPDRRGAADPGGGAGFEKLNLRSVGSGEWYHAVQGRKVAL